MNGSKLRKVADIDFMSKAGAWQNTGRLSVRLRSDQQRGAKVPGSRG